MEGGGEDWGRGKRQRDLLFVGCKGWRTLAGGRERESQRVGMADGESRVDVGGPWRGKVGLAGRRDTESAVSRGGGASRPQGDGRTRYGHSTGVGVGKERDGGSWESAREGEERPNSGSNQRFVGVTFTFAPSHASFTTTSDLELTPTPYLAVHLNEPPTKNEPSRRSLLPSPPHTSPSPTLSLPGRTRHEPSALPDSTSRAFPHLPSRLAVVTFRVWEDFTQAATELFTESPSAVSRLPIPRSSFQLTRAPVAGPLLHPLAT